MGLLGLPLYIDFPYGLTPYPPHDPFIFVGGIAHSLLPFFHSLHRFFRQVEEAMPLGRVGRGGITHCTFSFFLPYCTLGVADPSGQGIREGRTGEGPTTNSTIAPCTALCCTVLHCTVLHCTVLHCASLYCTILYTHVPHPNFVQYC